MVPPGRTAILGRPVSRTETPDHFSFLSSYITKCYYTFTFLIGLNKLVSNEELRNLLN